MDGALAEGWIDLELARARKSGLVDNCLGGCVDEAYTESQFPDCMSCGEGVLVPLSDFGSHGASVHYKAWICTNPVCKFNLKIRNGEVYMNEPVVDLRHTARR